MVVRLAVYSFSLKGLDRQFLRLYYFLTMFMYTLLTYLHATLQVSQFLVPLSCRAKTPLMQLSSSPEKKHSFNEGDLIHSSASQNLLRTLSKLVVAIV